MYLGQIADLIIKTILSISMDVGYVCTGIVDQSLFQFY